MVPSPPSLELLVENYLEEIYTHVLPDISFMDLAQEILKVMRLNEAYTKPAPETNNWTEEDVVVITYGDSILHNGDKPLKVLKRFLDNHCEGCINSVHILPFFPFSSDYGFSVIDYLQVNPELGDWADIEAIAEPYRLMADLVINHCSSESQWFANFKRGEGRGHDFFATATNEDDLSIVVRPRTSPLLHEVQTPSGKKKVWCTFSHDQIDLDFKNPAVLLEFCRIIRFYLDKGVRLFRLDAVAFLWKEPGTACINLPQTHMIVQLLRLLIEHAQNDGVVITETNIPVLENLSYFGENNEANWIYNFPLPPLLLHTLLTGDSDHLRAWMMSMPPAFNGTAYFNFIASHDGIGLRPVEGILTDEEIKKLAATAVKFGGKVSWRTVSEHKKKPYELNISLYDALQGDVTGKDDLGDKRFLCAHAIMFGMEGIPGIYIHSLLATSNDYERLNASGENRDINRRQWLESDVERVLADQTSQHARIYGEIKKLLSIRKKQPAFHPNATHFTLHLRNDILCFWRQSLDRRQSIFAISNVTNESLEITLSSINLISNQRWFDLISEEEIDTTLPLLHFEPFQTRWITNMK